MDFLKQLPHIEPYGNPQNFLYVIAAILPIFIGLFFKKRFAWYEILVSLFLIVTMLTGGKTNQLAALGIYLIWQMVLVLFYKQYRKVRDGKWIFYLVSLLSLLPIIFVKVQPAIDGTQSLLGFIGISYLTFRSVGIIIELRDGVKEQFEREIDITKAIKKDLEDIMMSYMMPSKFLYRKELPLTPNGKIDIKGLINEVNNR